MARGIGDAITINGTWPRQRCWIQEFLESAVLDSGVLGVRNFDSIGSTAMPLDPVSRSARVTMFEYLRGRTCRDHQVRKSGVATCPGVKGHQYKG